MSFYNLLEKYKTPENALEHLLDEGEKSYRGSAHIFQTYDNIEGGNKVGSYKSLTRNMLKGRSYTVNWCDDSVEVHFKDCVWFSRITGRSFPDKVSCDVVMFPTNA